MRIALVVPDLKGHSGWSRYGVNLGTPLAAMGHEIHAIVEKTVHVPWCKEYPILHPAHHLHHPFLCAWNAWGTDRILRKIQPDVLHFIAEPYALMLPFLHKHFQQSFMTVHGTYAVSLLKRGGLIRLIAQRGYGKIDGIISVSNFTKDYLQRNEPLLFEREALEAKIQVIPNAVTMPTKSLIHGASTPRLIMSVGAVKERKGYIQTIDACAAFTSRSNTDFQYHIYGSLEEDPTYVSMLQKHIADRGLLEHVFLHGSVSEEELQQAYRKADLFILLSLHRGYDVEGFGIVFLEANSWGVPVIGPTTGGCPEAIQHGETGYICNPEEPEKIAKYMVDILDQNNIASHSCRAWAEKHNAEHMTARIAQYYIASSSTP